MSERVLPQTQDRETAPFFEAALAGRLVIKRCTVCEIGIHPPTAHCPNCGSWRTEWFEVPGDGALRTWTIVEHGVHPAYPPPYAIVIVEVAGVRGVRMVGELPGRPPLREGMAMRVRFQTLADGVALPQWDPA